MVVQTRAWNLKQLLCLSIRQIEITFHAFLSMSFSVTRHASSQLWTIWLSLYLWSFWKRSRMDVFFHIALCVSQCLLLCHDEFAMVSFLSSCLGSFSLERSTSCQVILEVFFEFLKWLNPPIVRPAPHLQNWTPFPYGLNAAGTALSPFFVVLQWSSMFPSLRSWGSFLYFEYFLFCKSLFVIWDFDSSWSFSYCFLTSSMCCLSL